MEPAEVLKKYSVKLLSLPVKQPKFIALLKIQNLLPGDTESKIIAIHLTEAGAAQLLVNQIERSLIISRNDFDKLISVMKQYKDGGMEELANQMESAVIAVNPEEPPIAGLSIKDEDKDDVIVDELWKKEELYNMGYQKKKISTLPDAQKSNVLDQVLLLLLTANDNEDNAALCYLEPLPGHNEIFKYWQRDNAGVHAEFAIYLIGNYGACPAAVRQIKPGSAIGGATTAPNLAFRCFKNLNAIIGMGVACGVEKEANLCDVLVADKINNYDQARLEEGGTLNRGFALPTSSLLSQIFRQKIMWPDDDEIKERLDKCKMKPKIKQGVILSGPYLIDNKEIKKELIQTFASEAIGIEMEAAYLFKAAQQVPTHMTIVKAVCDFGDGKKDKVFQPTAALLAANCVKRYLDEGAVQMLQRGPTQ